MPTTRPLSLRSRTSRAVSGMLASAARPFVLACSAASRWSKLALVAGSLLVGAPTALAQGTSDLFPEPLSSEEIESALDRIGLAGDARLSALKSFEEYISRYLDLRKGDIENYLQGRTDLSSSDRTREEVEGRVSARERLLKRIAALDNQLFDSITAAAGGDAATRATRERLHAERRRDWAASNSFMGRGSRLELTELLGDVLERGNTALDEATRANIDAQLQQHEQSLTAMYRKLLDLAVNEPLAMHDARSGSNLRRPQPEPGKQPAPEEWGAYFRGVEEIRRKVREPQLEVRKSIRRANRETAAKIADLLPVAVAQSFRDAFMNRAYASAASPRDPSPAFLNEAKSAAEKGEIDASTLAKIEEMVKAHVRKRNDRNERIARAIDDERDGSDGFSFVILAGEDDEGGDDKQPESAKLLAERTKLDDALNGAIEGVAPSVIAERKKEGESRTFNFNGAEIALPSGAAVEGQAIMVVAGAAGEGGDMAEPIIFSESFVPGEEGDGGSFAFASLSNGPQVGVVQPMQQPLVDRIAKQFSLPADQMSVLQLLFDDYRNRCREIDEGDLAELKSIPAGGGGFTIVSGEDTAAPPKATAESTRRRHELRRAVTDRIVALDREFFEGLGAACGDHVPANDVTRLRRERERAAYIAADNMPGGFMMMGFGRSKAPTADLAEVLRIAELDKESLAAVQSRFDAWDVAATDAFRSRYADRVAAQEAQEEFERKMEAQSAAEGRPGEVRIESGNEEFERIRAIQNKAAKADDLTRGVNEGAIEDMIAAIQSAEGKQALRDAWHRTVWPQVFRDKRNAKSRLDAALALPSVTGDRATAIKTIAAEHAVEYRRISDEMIAANEAATKDAPRDPNGGISFDPGAMRKRQETTNRLTFERDELNEKTFRRLKEQLSEEELKKVGELPSRKKSGGGFALPGGGEARIRIGG